MTPGWPDCLGKMSRDSKLYSPWGRKTPKIAYHMHYGRKLELIYEKGSPLDADCGIERVVNMDGSGHGRSDQVFVGEFYEHGWITHVALRNLDILRIPTFDQKVFGI